jgi:hypothetical protein
LGKDLTARLTIEGEDRLSTPLTALMLATKACSRRLRYIVERDTCRIDGEGKQP